MVSSFFIIFFSVLLCRKGCYNSRCPTAPKEISNKYVRGKPCDPVALSYSPAKSEKNNQVALLASFKDLFLLKMTESMTE